MTCTFLSSRRAGKDQLAFFTTDEQTVHGRPDYAPLRLRTDETQSTVVNSVTVRARPFTLTGSSRKGLLTDENGRVTLPALAPSETPLLYYSKEDGSRQVGKNTRVISAAYSRLTVFPSGGSDPGTM